MAKKPLRVSSLIKFVLMTNRIATLILIVILLLHSQNRMEAQTITKSTQYVGLNAADGSILLPQEYIQIDLVDDAHEVYLCKNRFSLYGLYFSQTGYMLDCKYDEIIAEDDVYILRQAKKYGWLQHVSRSEKPYTILQEPQYDALINKNRYEYIICDNMICGVVSFEHEAKVIIPMKYSEPIQYSYEKQFYLFGENHQITMLIPNIATGEVREITADYDGIHRDEYFVRVNTAVGKSYEQRMTGVDSTLIYDVHSGKLLGVYLTDPKNNISSSYRKYWFCIATETKLTKRTYEIKLINPFNGEVFYQTILSKNTSLEMNGFVVDRDLDRPAEVILDQGRGRQHTLTYIGTLVGYQFIPDPTPRIEKITYSSGSGKKPFFMPGKD